MAASDGIGYISSVFKCSILVFPHCAFIRKCGDALQSSGYLLLVCHVDCTDSSAQGLANGSDAYCAECGAVCSGHLSDHHIAISTDSFDLI